MCMQADSYAKTPDKETDEPESVLKSSQGCLMAVLNDCVIVQMDLESPAQQ